MLIFCSDNSTAYRETRADAMCLPLHRQLMRHNVVSKGKRSPLLTRGKQMITTMFIKVFNKLINESMVQARIVNTQTVEFNDWCARLAHGSTVTAADVSAVMKQMEDKLPEILSLNAKVICSPGGLVIRPKVSGTLTQSELKAKLEARKAAETDPEKAAKIDVNRELSTSDLAVSDCTLSIEVDLPQDWNDTFKKRTTLKRVSKNTESTENAEETENTENGGGENSGSTENGSATENAEETENTENGGGENGSENGGGELPPSDGGGY